MLNQVIIVGRISELIRISDDYINMIISVPQSFKNKDGEYGVDLIDCKLIGNITNTTNDYCKIGNVVGIKGRLKINNDKNNNRIIEVIAEKVSFLGSKKVDE